MKCRKTISTFFILLFLFVSCKNKLLPNQEMITLLQSADKYEDNPQNIFCPEAILRFSDSLLNASSASIDVMKVKSAKAIALLQLGEEQKAINVLKDMLNKTSLGDFEQHGSIMKDLALAY